MAINSYTAPGGSIPPADLTSPTLLFHKWHAYDRFESPKAFARESCSQKFLSQVAVAIHKANLDSYSERHTLFDRACEAVGACSPLTLRTEWRLIVGWATNPALEVGLTLDPLYGFPFIPGSAVKGLLHRCAEGELLEEVDAGPSIPAAPDTLPEEPPPELLDSLRRAGRVWALFGSLHLERDRQQSAQPEAPRERLQGWLDVLMARWPRAAEVPQSWKPVKSALSRFCKEPATGGVVVCFDAVPSPKVFSKELKPIVSVDVLTPQWNNKPNPLVFLAVRDGVAFEFRYRVRRWSEASSSDEAGETRAEALEDLSPEDIEELLGGWLSAALAELGAGGKTSAGYGYLRDSLPPIPPQLEEPSPVDPLAHLSEEERAALGDLPDDIDPSRAVAVMDKALIKRPAHLRALVLRFRELYPGKQEEWASSLRAASKRRAAGMRAALEREESS